jgi:hypothetical protein
MTVRIMNLVAPLSHEDTAMRIMDTAGSSRDRSGAVSILIGESLRSGDVDSVNWRIDTASRIRHTVLAVANSTAGIGVLMSAADSRKAFAVRLFYVCVCPFNGRTGRGAARLAGALPVRQPVRFRPPQLALGSGSFNELECAQ